MNRHQFLQSPPHLCIVAALRRGQVLGFGGNEVLAETISQTRLGEIMPDEQFWNTVIHFFVRNLGTSYSQAGPIVDFIYFRKYGEIDRDPLEPTFDMKGRTLEALKRRVAEWHERLAIEERRPKTVWEPSGVDRFETEVEDKQHGTIFRWKIVEILNSIVLRDESREMRHCVFSYEAACRKGQTAIFSLQCAEKHSSRWMRMLTIELNRPKRAIVQVRGFANATTVDLKRKRRYAIALEILKSWAQEEKLGIACTL